ncbi:MAG: hypothetical protein NC543_02790 [bacterium]|nr:hypothetical protein [bacterium]MCM1375594.1 hypothetical protein [Muribaculum sp.]
MNEQQRKMELCLDEQIAASKQRSMLLAADDRADEANLEKVRINVYGIFKTILSAAERVCGEDDLAKKRFFLQKAEQIPTSWMTSYEKAKKHGDIEKMHIESIKLDTIQEIKDMYMQIWEETI